MKKLLLSAFVAMSVLPAMADLEGDGYYRVQNAITKRYAYLRDNKAIPNGGTTSIDVRAIELYLDFNKASSDPSTVLYLEKTGNGKAEYDIAGQGTSLHQFIGYYMYVIDGKVVDGQKSYMAYGKASGLTKYLGDIESNLSKEVGEASVDVLGDRRQWYIHPVVADDGDSYFGVAPTMTSNGKYYAPMYAGFPYDAYSEGVKFYTVSGVYPLGDTPAVCIKEVDGVIPSGTAVIIECANPLPIDNRLNVGPEGAAADVMGNMLKGVYFENYGKIHMNLTPYDRKTMRILTVKDGQLVFDVTDIENLPRNQAYLQLTGDDQYSVNCYKVMTEEEYNDYVNAVDVIPADHPVDVYSLDGRLVKAGILRQDVPTLGKGLYILRSGDASEKLTVH